MTAARVLVVEDEFIIAEEIAAILSDAGYALLGPVGAVEAADALLDSGPCPDFAVVDANLRGGSSALLAARLRTMNVPFCVCTGYRLDDLKATFGEVVLLQKPVDAHTLVATVRSGLASRPSPRPA